MGSKERREREKAELRDKILVAARELFVEEGFDAVTMRKIAERIEYSPTALYLHFETKDEILRALCDEDFRALAGHFAGIAALPDPIERLRAAGHAYVQFGLQFPNHYRLMFMTPHPRQEAEESAIAKGDPDQDSYAFLKGILAQCVELGLFRPELQDVELLAQVVWAAVHGVVSIEIAKCNDDWVDWRPFAVRADFLLDALLNGLLVGTSPPGPLSPPPWNPPPGEGEAPSQEGRPRGAAPTAASFSALDGRTRWSAPAGSSSGPPSSSPSPGRGFEGGGEREA